MPEHPRQYVVNGPFPLLTAGRVETGNECILDPTREEPIRMDTGNQAVLKLGDQVHINEGFYLACYVSVSIGNQVLIAPEVIIINNGHPLDWQSRHDHWLVWPQDRLEKQVGAPIAIEDDVWIGTRAVI